MKDGYGVILTVRLSLNFYGNLGKLKINKAERVTIIEAMRRMYIEGGLE